MLDNVFAGEWCQHNGWHAWWAAFTPLRGTVEDCTEAWCVATAVWPETELVRQGVCICWVWFTKLWKHLHCLGAPHLPTWGHEEGANPDKLQASAARHCCLHHLFKLKGRDVVSLKRCEDQKHLDLQHCIGSSFLTGEVIGAKAT